MTAESEGSTKDGSWLPLSAATELNNEAGSTEVDKGAGRRTPSMIDGDEDDDNNG